MLRVFEKSELNYFEFLLASSVSC